MNFQARPEAIGLDPESGDIPPSLQSVLTDPDVPILLVVAAEADETAARLAIRFAEARADTGAATVLADAAFHPPRLHAMLDVPNLEGIADLFLFGASVFHVATRPPGRAFDLIPTGAYIPDPQAVIRSERWERVAEEFAASRAMLMLFVPAGSAGVGELSRRVGQAVVIATDRQADRALGRLSPTCDVRAIIAPRAASPAAPSPRAPSSGAATGVEAPGRAAPSAPGAAGVSGGAAGAAAGAGAPAAEPPAAGSLGSAAERRERVGGGGAAGAATAAGAAGAAGGTIRGAADGGAGAAASGAPASEGAARPATSPFGAEEPDLSEPLVIRQQSKRRRLSPILLAALLLVLAAGGWFAYQQYLLSAEPVAPETATAAASPERGAAVETPIPISVGIEVHSDLGSAQERVEMLRSAEPRIGFYLAPVVSNGDLYYRVLAGPVQDQEAGMALMERLVASGQKTAVEAWAVQPTRFAYHLGEYDTRAAARARVDSLAAAEIPAYIIPIRYDPGPPRYRVYGGAFETRVEAEVMGEMLRSAGIEPTLVPRTGEPVR